MNKIEDAMANYLELQKQIAALQKEADALKASERRDVIQRMKEAIAAYDISAVELGFGARVRSSIARKKDALTTRTAAVIYSDTHGNTWGGIGKRPNWLREAIANGRKLEDFASPKK